MFQDVPEEKISLISDRTVLDQQARFNTRRLNSLQRLFDDPTPQTAQNYYEGTKRDLEKYLLTCPEEEKSKVQERIEICEENLGLLRQEDKSQYPLRELVEHLRKEYEGRKSRSRRLVRRRNELVKIDEDRKREEAESARQKIEEDFSVVGMELKRVDAVGILADLTRDSQITARRLRESGHRDYAATMEALSRTAYVALNLLNKVDLKPKENNQ